LGLQNKLNAVKSSVEQLVKRLSVEPNVSLATIKRQFKQQISRQPFNHDITAAVYIDQKQ
jgi:hypothetical protein